VTVHSLTHSPHPLAQLERRMDKKCVRLWLTHADRTDAWAHRARLTLSFSATSRYFVDLVTGGCFLRCGTERTTKAPMSWMHTAEIYKGCWRLRNNSPQACALTRALLWQCETTHAQLCRNSGSLQGSPLVYVKLASTHASRTRGRRQPKSAPLHRAHVQQSNSSPPSHLKLLRVGTRTRHA
jgi:hypothetical protein